MYFDFHFVVTFTDQFGKKWEEKFDEYLKAVALYNYLRNSGCSDVKITQVEGKYERAKDRDL